MVLYFIGILLRFHRDTGVMIRNQDRIGESPVHVPMR
jgi:hypothetical protein